MIDHQLHHHAGSVGVVALTHHEAGFAEVAALVYGNVHQGHFGAEIAGHTLVDEAAVVGAVVEAGAGAGHGEASGAGEGRRSAGGVTQKGEGPRCGQTGAVKGFGVADRRGSQGVDAGILGRETVGRAEDGIRGAQSLPG